MIRNPPMFQTHSTIWVWPLFFWRKCHKCGMEFRREPGWAFLAHHRFRSTFDDTHFCGRCFGTQDEVEAYIISWRPPPPPPRT